MELSARVVVLGVPVGPPCHVVGIHDELEKVPPVPGVSQVGHHIYIKLLRVLRFRRFAGMLGCGRVATIIDPFGL